MRQGPAFALSALFLLCAVAASGALQSNPPDVGGAQGNPSDVGGTARTTTTAKAAHHKKAAGHSVKGTVASVDATAKGFVVHPAKGEDVTLKVNDKTRYPKGKTWDDVKADAKVTVSYHSDGTDNWALTVKFAAEPKAKAEKPPSNPSDVGGTARTTGTG